MGACGELMAEMLYAGGHSDPESELRPILQSILGQMAMIRSEPPLIAPWIDNKVASAWNQIRADYPVLASVFHPMEPVSRPNVLISLLLDAKHADQPPSPDQPDHPPPPVSSESPNPSKEEL